MFTRGKCFPSRHFPWPMLVLVTVLLSGCAAVSVLQGAWQAVGWLAVAALLGACLPEVSSESLEKFTVTYKTSFDVSELLPANGGDGTKGFILTSTQEANLGQSVALGDLNGDGIADLAAGADAVNVGAVFAGQVSVILGRNGSFPATIPIEVISDGIGRFFWGQTADDRAGFSVAIVPSVDGDAFDDLVVGAPNTTGGYGRVAVVFGANTLPGSQSLAGTLLDGARGTEFLSTTTDSGTGHAVTGGDINGDGLGDVAMGAPYATYGGNNNGRLYEMLGTATWPAYQDLDPGYAGVNNTIQGPFLEALMGTAIAGGGDINGDGIDDVVIAARGQPPEPPHVFIRFGGSPTGINNSIPTLSHFRLDATYDYDGLGESVAIGDVNGDGRTDMIVGEPLADRIFGATYYEDFNVGRVHVIFGRSGLEGQATSPVTFTGANGFTLVGNEADGLAGHRVAAGDINGDGIGDIVFSVPYVLPPKVHVVFGTRTSGAAVRHISQGPAAAAIELHSIPWIGEAGALTALAADGDIDGDGRNDIVIGWAGDYDGYGRVFVIFNKALQDTGK